MQQPQRPGCRPQFSAHDNNVAAHPRATYERLQTSAPVQEGGVVVGARREVEEVLRNPDVFSPARVSAAQRATATAPRTRPIGPSGPPCRAGSAAVANQGDRPDQDDQLCGW